MPAAGALRATRSARKGVPVSPWERRVQPCGKPPRAVSTGSPHTPRTLQIFVLPQGTVRCGKERARRVARTALGTLLSFKHLSHTQAPRDPVRVLGRGDTPARGKPSGRANPTPPLPPQSENAEAKSGGPTGCNTAARGHKRRVSTIFSLVRGILVQDSSRCGRTTLPQPA